MGCDYCDQCGAETAANCLQSLLDVNGCAQSPAHLPHDASQWQGTVCRWRTSRHHQQSSWLPCSSAWLAVSSAPLIFVCVCKSAPLHFTRLKNFPDDFFPDDFFGGARIGSANGEACFTTDGEETAGCLCLLPGLKLLWCRRLANELTGNVFRKLASLLASRLAKSDRDTYCSGSENSH